MHVTYSHSCSPSSVLLLIRLGISTAFLHGEIDFSSNICIRARIFSGNPDMPRLLSLQVSLLLSLTALRTHAQLFDSLQLHASRVPVGDPTVTSMISPEGPKGIVYGDFDLDQKSDVAVSNSDGTLTVLYGTGLSMSATPLRLSGFESVSTSCTRRQRILNFAWSHHQESR